MTRSHKDPRPVASLQEFRLVAMLIDLCLIIKGDRVAII